MVHGDREGALDGDLSIFDLSWVLVVFPMVGCNDVACLAGGLHFHQLKKKDLRVDTCEFARSSLTRLSAP